MIIRELDINSFGKIENFNIELTDGLNVIYGKNESGKSTIAHFIETMLFGFGKLKSDRQKCIPWDKDTAFGSMCVETKSGHITVFRKSGKTQRFDTQTFSPEDKDFSSFIPQSRETYRKTVYCRENDSSYFGSNEEIDKKLSNLISTGDESVNATRAIEILEGKRKALRAFRGTSGKYYAVEEKLTQLRTEHYKAVEADNKRLENLRKIENLKKEYELELKKHASLSEACDSPFFLKELDNEIEQQKQFIASFPQEDKAYPESIRFFSKTFLMSIIFTMSMFIISYFFNPLLPFSPVPLLLFLIWYSCKYFITKREQRLFLNKLLCKDYAEYEKLTEDKNAATAHYNSLLEIKAAKTGNSSHRIEELNGSTLRLLDLKEKISALEKENASVSSRSADEIISEISYFTEQKEDILIKVEALDAAIRALKQAKAVIQEDFTPLINKKAKAYIDMIAPKKGRDVSVKNDFSLFLTDPLPQDVSECSQGFKEEVYLCFRIALSEVLFPTDFPLILDNPFSASDNYRENALLDLFLQIAEKRQVILFTNRENARFSQMDCNYIDISPEYDV